MPILSSIEELMEKREILRHDRDDTRLRLVLCAGTACQASGSNGLIRIAKRHVMENQLHDKISLCITGCHGFCEMGPFILVEPLAAFYSQLKHDDVPRIIEATLSGNLVEDLLYRDPKTGEKYDHRDDIPFFRGQQRTLLGLNKKIDPIRIYDYVVQDGYRALERTLSAGDPEWVIDEVKRSGLRGRGGAGFPAGVKWEMLSKQPGNRGKFGRPRCVHGPQPS
jgi:NADH-quinone oxidoreductase subunit F